MNPDQKKEQSYSKAQRILALLGAGLIGGLVILLLVLLFTGGSEGALLSVLFCLMVLPCVFYVILRYARLTSEKKE